PRRHALPLTTSASTTAENPVSCAPFRLFELATGCRVPNSPIEVCGGETFLSFTSLQICMWISAAKSRSLAPRGLAVSLTCFATNHAATRAYGIETRPPLAFMFGGLPFPILRASLNCFETRNFSVLPLPCKSPCDNPCLFCTRKVCYVSGPCLIVP